MLSAVDDLEIDVLVVDVLELDVLGARHFYYISKSSLYVPSLVFQQMNFFIH
jgi:hypothetical protein